MMLREILKAVKYVKVIIIFDNIYIKFQILVNEGYFVHFFAPSDLPPLPKYVLFVLDTSGSMFGTRIRQLKDAMNSILSDLKPEDKFNIIEFATDVQAWDLKNIPVSYRESRTWSYSKMQNLPEVNI